MSVIDFSRVRDWTFNHALPVWAERGVDRLHGGFEEELGLEFGAPCVESKRTRVAGRQIYVFSHAALLGWQAGADIADQGLNFLVSSAWLGPDGGWARRVSRVGAVLDATPDLYDLAFVLFGLSWHFRLTGAVRTRELALLTLAFIDRRMRRGDAFAHELGSAGAQFQNPHMHLLESCISAAAAFGDDIFVERANELVALFETRFFDGETLGEQFGENWERAGDLIEPGHHLEWAWILVAYHKLTNVDVRESATALVAFAERHGVNKRTGLTANYVSEDGLNADWSSRTWPNTERIKAHLALFELIGSDPRAPVQRSSDALFSYHLGQAPRGLWMESFDSEGRPQARNAPASTLYHVFLSFTELLRLQSTLEKLP